VRLTDKYLSSLKYQGKQIKIFDDGLPNFGVRLYKPGPSFIVMLGKERRLKTIGRYPKLSLKEARTRALALLNDYDPHTLEISSLSAVEAFLGHCIKHNKPRTVKDYTRLLNKHFPSGNMSSLTKNVLLKKLATLSNTPAEQFHATAVFQTFLNWCVHNGQIEFNPLAGLKNQGKLGNRDRVLTDDELKAVWDTLGTGRFSTIVRLMILTGQRKGEISHLILQDDMLFLPKEYAKNGHDHTFPIGELTKQYFLSVKYNGWSKAKTALDNASGVTDWTFHDLRRTFATNHARLGTPIHVVEKLLNHVSGSFSGVAGIYNRYSYLTEMKEAVTVYELHLKKLLGE
jgi:integrase